MIKRRKFGRSEVEISEISLGAWALGGVGYGKVTKKEASEVMQTAYEAGINLFDTADFYGFGESEKRISAFLKTKPKGSVLIATKGGLQFEEGPIRKDFSKKYLAEALNESLKRLEKEAVDLYQLHGPNLTDLEQGECLEFLVRAKKEGKIRWGGVSIYDPLQAIRWMSEEPIDCLQLPYNLINRRLEVVLEKIREAGKALILREVFAYGFLSGKYSETSVFPKDDHRRRFSTEEKKEILTQMKQLRDKMNWSQTELFNAALPHCLNVKEASTVLLGAKTKDQLEEHLENYKRSTGHKTQVTSHK